MSFKEVVLDLIGIPKLLSEMGVLIEKLNQVSILEMSYGTDKTEYKKVFNLRNGNSEALVSRFYLLNCIVACKDPANLGRPNLQKNMETLMTIFDRNNEVWKDPHILEDISFKKINEFLWLFASYDLTSFTSLSKEEMKRQQLPCPPRPQKLYIPNDFYPEHAKCIYQYVASALNMSPKKMTVCDPNAKFGEQLLAAASADVARYVGFNATLEMFNGYNEMLANHFPVFQELNSRRFKIEGGLLETYHLKDTSGRYDSKFDLLCANMADETNGSVAHVKTLLQQWSRYVRIGGYVALCYKIAPREIPLPGTVQFEYMRSSAKWDQLLPQELAYRYKIGVTTVNHLVTPVFLFQRVEEGASDTYATVTNTATNTATSTASNAISNAISNKNAELKKRKHDIAESEREAKRSATTTNNAVSGGGIAAGNSGNSIGSGSGAWTSMLRPSLLSLHTGSLRALDFLQSFEKDLFAGKTAMIQDMLHYSVALTSKTLQARLAPNNQYVLAHFAIFGLLPPAILDGHKSLLALFHPLASTPLPLAFLVDRSNKNVERDGFRFFKAALQSIANSLCATVADGSGTGDKCAVVLAAYKVITTAEYVLSNGYSGSGTGGGAVNGSSNGSCSGFSDYQQWLDAYSTDLLQHKLGHTIEEVTRHLNNSSSDKDSFLGYLAYLNSCFHIFSAGDQAQIPNTLFTTSNTEYLHIIQRNISNFPVLFNTCFVAPAQLYERYYRHTVTTIQLVEHLVDNLSYKVRESYLQPSADCPFHIIVLMKPPPTAAAQTAQSSSSQSGKHRILPQLIIHNSNNRQIPVTITAGMHFTKTGLSMPCFSSVAEVSIDTIAETNSTMLEIDAALTRLSKQWTSATRETIRAWRVCKMNFAQQTRFAERVIASMTSSTSTVAIDDLVVDTLAAESGDAGDSFWSVYTRLHDTLIEKHGLVNGSKPRGLRFRQVEKRLQRSSELMRLVCRYFQWFTEDRWACECDYWSGAETSSVVSSSTVTNLSVNSSNSNSNKSNNSSGSVSGRTDTSQGSAGAYSAIGAVSVDRAQIPTSAVGSSNKSGSVAAASKINHRVMPEINHASSSNSAKVDHMVIPTINSGNSGGSSGNSGVTAGATTTSGGAVVIDLSRSDSSDGNNNSSINNDINKSIINNSSIDINSAAIAHNAKNNASECSPKTELVGDPAEDEYVYSILV